MAETIESNDKVQSILSILMFELEFATSKFGAFHNAHEGYAVLKEEVDELWDEIKNKNRNDGRMCKEALQVAAMALRVIYDLADDKAMKRVYSDVKDRLWVEQRKKEN